jgi:hypothetical protein
MKKFIFGLFAVVSILFITSCADSKRIKMPVEKITNGIAVVVDTVVNVKPYGLFNEEKKKIDGVEYKLVVGNIIWSGILIETVGVPIYLVGWRLFEPIGLEEDKIKIVK